MPEPQLVDSTEAYNFVRYRDQIIAVPKSFGPTDLQQEYEAVIQRPNVFVGSNINDVRAVVALDDIVHGVPLKVTHMLNTPANTAFWTGNHPAFAHTLFPQYDTIQISAAPSSPHCNSANLSRFAHTLTWFRAKVARDVPDVTNGDIDRFIESRDYASLLITAASDGLHFIQSVPLTLGFQPWIIHIEVPTTLFLPFIHVDNSWSFCPANSWIYRIVRSLLVSNRCLGIITSMAGTQRALPVLFRSEGLQEKIFHLPFSSRERPSRLNNGKRFLFTTSWHQHERSFYYRGGVDAICIFFELARRFSGLHLTIRARLPPNLNPDLRRRIAASSNVLVIEDKIDDPAMDALFANADFYLLPALSLHSISTLQAMSHGCICLLADSWGSDEYLHHGVNGLRVVGREGRYWQYKSDIGFLAERSHGVENPDLEFIGRCVGELDPLIANDSRRHAMSAAARRYVMEHHSVDRERAGFETIMGIARTRAAELLPKQANAANATSAGRSDFPTPE